MGVVLGFCLLLMYLLCIVDFGSSPVLNPYLSSHVIQHGLEKEEGQPWVDSATSMQNTYCMYAQVGWNRMHAHVAFRFLC